MLATRILQIAESTDTECRERLHAKLRAFELTLLENGSAAYSLRPMKREAGEIRTLLHASTVAEAARQIYEENVGALYPVIG